MPPTKLLFLDGGMGTYLEDRHQVIFDKTKPAWSSSVSSELLHHVHNEYAQHADILLSATYQACTANMVPESSDSYSKDDSAAARMRALLQECVDAARDEKRHSRRQVALSLGPYGATMVPSTEYSGEYPDEMLNNVEALQVWHAQRLRTYMGAVDKTTDPSWQGIDYVVFETLVGNDEILATRRAMSEVFSRESPNKGDRDASKPYWISVNYSNGDATNPLAPQGQTPSEIARAMMADEKHSSRPWGIGVNCTKLAKIEAAIAEYEAGVEEVLSSSPNAQWPWLVIYPDGAQNLRYNTTTKTWDTIGAESGGPPALSWAAQMEQILVPVMARGRWPGIVVGGCCKTTPDDIAQLRALMERRGAS